MLPEERRRWVVRVATALIALGLAGAVVATARDDENRTAAVRMATTLQSFPGSWQALRTATRAKLTSRNSICFSTIRGRGRVGSPRFTLDRPIRAILEDEIAEAALVFPPASQRKRPQGRRPRTGGHSSEWSFTLQPAASKTPRTNDASVLEICRSV